MEERHSFWKTTPNKWRELKPIVIQTRDLSEDEKAVNTNRQTRWSCAIQAVLEFHRVINDVYPFGSKQLRLVVSDTGGRFTTPEWREELVSYEEILESFLSSLPDPNADPAMSSILSGLSICMDAFTLPTPAQSRIAQSFKLAYALPNAFENLQLPQNMKPKSEMGKKFAERLKRCRIQTQKETFSKNASHPQLNCGTIIALTTIAGLEDFQRIVESVEEQIESRNELYESSTTGLSYDQSYDLPILPVHALVLYVIHINALNETPLSAETQKQIREFCGKPRRGRVRPVLFASAGGSPLIKIIHRILHENYEIDSTTVSNIPMKEEATPSGTSVNYNVEMFHHRAAHSHLRRMELLDVADSPIVKDNGNYPTTLVKWSSVNSRFNPNDPPLFENSTPATVAYVKDRAALCISNFLLTGQKYVLLDVDASQPVETLRQNFHENRISHFLSLDSNLGAMAIRAMRIRKTADGEEAESAAAAAEFAPTTPKTISRHWGYLIDAMQLDIDPVDSLREEGNAQAEIFAENAKRCRSITAYWPLFEKDSIVYQMGSVFNEVLAAAHNPKLSADDLSRLQTQIFKLIGDRKPISVQSSLFSAEAGPEEKRKAALTELGTILRNLAALSDQHDALFQTFRTASGLDLDEEAGRLPTKRALAPRSRSNSPSPKKPKGENNWESGENIRLFEIFKTRADRCWKGWRDFEGRIKAPGTIAPLYVGLALNESEPKGGVRPSGRPGGGRGGQPIE